jgi:Putative prokaryotic signal transducing protein
MVEVYRGSYLEAMNIKNLLENNNIIVFTANEQMSSLEPWTVSSGGYGSAILRVNQEEYDTAKKVVDDFNNGEYALKT